MEATGDTHCRFDKDLSLLVICISFSFKVTLFAVELGNLTLSLIDSKQVKCLQCSCFQDIYVFEKIILTNKKHPYWYRMDLGQF